MAPSSPAAALLFFVVASLAGVPAAAGAAELPQGHAWQAALRQYLASLKVEDVTIVSTAWANSDFAGRPPERLYRDWVGLGISSRVPANSQLHAEARFFTLAGIERADGIYCFLNPAGMTWWTQFDVPGNPFHASEPARRRALVVAVVDMIMLESSWADPLNIKPDFMGANLGTWAYTYLHAKDLLPPDAQRAFEQGMLYYLEQMERVAPRDGNTNMDMREIATLATLHKVFPDALLRKRFAATARRILFGDAHRGPDTSDPRRGTFHPAGYIGEADGPETSYNGISLFHLLEAAITTRGDPAWDAFLPEVIHRMLRFKAHNTFPEPDGRWEGPSSWSTRTNDPYVRDQRDRPWRAIASAMLSDDGLYLLGDPTGRGPQPRGVPDRDAQLAQIRQGLTRLTRGPLKGEGPGGGLEPVKWREDHWPADIPYTYDDYIDGSYARFAKLAAGNSELLLPPFARPGDFSVNFDNEFWSAKRGDWGFQVEAVPHHSRSYDTGGSGALAGGSLAAFWTKQSGLVLLGRLPDKWNYVTWRPQEGAKEENRWSVDRWTTHHLWGRTTGGKAFSSARQRHPFVSYELDRNPPTVRVMGHLGPRGTVEEEGAIIDNDHVAYRRTFEQLATGLRVSSELISRGEAATDRSGKALDRTDRVTELWENLPVYIGPGPRAEVRLRPPETTIEFRVGGKWGKAGTESADGVEAIRITRFAHPVTIEFEAPQRIQLAGAPVLTSYQSRDLIQNVRVDLLAGKGGAGDGKGVPMPQRAAVVYTIRGGE